MTRGELLALRIICGFFIVAYSLFITWLWTLAPWAGLLFALLFAPHVVIFVSAFWFAGWIHKQVKKFHQTCN